MQSANGKIHAQKQGVFYNKPTLYHNVYNNLHEEKSIELANEFLESRLHSLYLKQKIKICPEEDITTYGQALT